METVQNTHCALVGCNTVDFLPVICPLCTLLFCKEHGFEDQHFCSKSAVQSGTAGEGVDNSRIPCSLPGCSNPSLAFKSQPDSSQLACPSCNSFFCIEYGALSARKVTILIYDVDIAMRRPINVPNCRFRLSRRVPKRRLKLQRF
jgi:AN1-like Zinc finger